MTTSRLSLALESGAVRLPEAGRIAVFGARAGDDLSALPTDRVQVIQRLYPDHAALTTAGYDCAVAPEGRYGAAVVRLPRAKAEARARIAEAREVADGPLIIDGQKTDGIDSVLRDIRKRAEVGEVMAKAHGKLFAVAGGDFSDWVGRETEVDGFVTMPGVFSADGLDRGSELLAAALPTLLPPLVADPGAGWGYLSRAILERGGVEELHLIEADHTALACARRNITDPRAVFHWADARSFVPDRPFDAVITNPPFHTGRAAEPALGLAFIDAARRLLTRQGELWLVANRHLPYEKALADSFREVREIGQDPGFKIFRAARPAA